MILAGDIGGTKTHLALFAPRGARLIPVRQQRFANRAYPGLVAILKEFLAMPRAAIAAACFGVAGPVVDGRCEGTNLPWVIDAALLQRAFRVGAAALINDLEATAYGI